MVRLIFSLSVIGVVLTLAAVELVEGFQAQETEVARKHLRDPEGGSSSSSLFRYSGAVVQTPAQERAETVTAPAPPVHTRHLRRIARKSPRLSADVVAMHSMSRSEAAPLGRP
jgi:hypothetical protein